MQSTFQLKLHEELLQSERRRTIILISIFLFGFAYGIIDRFLLQLDKDDQSIATHGSSWLFPITVITFEVFSLLYITRRIKTNRKRIPLHMQYLNTAFEICLPSFVLLWAAKEYPSYNVLQSPASYIYFVFIVLSTLRLNFVLSFFCGLLASLSSLCFSIFVYDHFSSTDAGRAIILLLTGVAAGLVAKQIRKSIDNSVKETEKRQKAETLFGKQISAEVAERLLANDGKMESRRIQVAVMFIDIRNFSGFAANKNPEEIVQYQNAFFSIVINTVTRFNGIVHQFLGDGCMVTFGAPLDLENPSQNAVDAATALLKRLDDSIQHGEIVPTRIGIGIHAGEVVTGNIGTAERQQYSVTGSVVILASRIEQLNKQFGSQLLVSEEVIRCIEPGTITANCFGKVSLKGWYKPISIYQLS